MVVVSNENVCREPVSPAHDQIRRVAGGRTAAADERVGAGGQVAVEQIRNDGVGAAQHQHAAGKRNQIVHAAAGAGDVARSK